MDRPSLEIKLDSKQILISRLVTGPGKDNWANRSLCLHVWHGREIFQRTAITHDAHSELPTSDLGTVTTYVRTSVQVSCLVRFKVIIRPRLYKDNKRGQLSTQSKV